MDRDFQRSYRQSTTSLLDRLEKALEWLDLEHGRVANYMKLLKEYYEGQRSKEHFFAAYQAMEALTIYESWKHTEGFFPGLKNKIEIVFKKGPLLTEGENASNNSNRPRNDGFVYILGGKLLHGKDVQIISIDGIRNTTIDNSSKESDFQGDISLRFQDNQIKVECKRPMHSHTLATNIDAAINQLARPQANTCLGLVAVDVSKLIEQPGQYVEASSLDAGSNYLIDRVAEILTPFSTQYRENWLLGLIGFASIPLVANARSTILQQDGNPYQLENLRTGSVSWVTIKNPKCSRGQLLREFQMSLMQTSHDIPPNSLPIH